MPVKGIRFLVTNRHTDIIKPDDPVQLLASAPNRSCGSRCVPIAFDTPTSDSYRVAAESRDPSVTSSRSHPTTPQDCRLKRWMPQILGTLQTEKRSPSTSELRNRSGRAVRKDEHVVARPGRMPSGVKSSLPPRHGFALGASVLVTLTYDGVTCRWS